MALFTYCLKNIFDGENRIVLPGDKYGFTGEGENFLIINGKGLHSSGNIFKDTDNLSQNKNKENMLLNLLLSSTFF